MKDGSPASTRSSSPKLDWMIKRGMVGVNFKTCPGFTLVSPFRTLSFGSFHTVLIYFAVVWVGSLFGFGGSVTEIEHKGLHDQLWRRKSMTLFGLHF